MAIFNEAYIAESLSKKNKSFKLKGVTINTDDTPTEKINEGLKLINSNWDSIIKEASECMHKHISDIKDGFEKELEKYPTPKDLEKAIKLKSALYTSEDHKNNPICGDFHLSFDTNPPLDKFHVFTLYVWFVYDKNKNPKLAFDSVYDG